MAHLRVEGQRSSGSFSWNAPYRYGHTDANLRNSGGNFFAGGGPGSFTVLYVKGTTVARVRVKAGPNQFGGTMRLLGQVTSKGCRDRFGGCSLGTKNWLYDHAGVSAYTSGGVVTKGARYTYHASFYVSALKQTTIKKLSASRFPWTTGTVSVTATGRGFVPEPSGGSCPFWPARAATLDNSGGGQSKNGTSGPFSC